MYYAVQYLGLFLVPALLFNWEGRGDFARINNLFWSIVLKSAKRAVEKSFFLC